MPLPLTEENVMLYPAVYNRKRLLGDFEVCVMNEGSLFRLSGRAGPYTSIGEYFNGAGKLILGREPDYVMALLQPDAGEELKQKDNAKSPMMLYKVTREQAGQLESGLDESQLEPTRLPDVAVF